MRDQLFVFPVGSLSVECWMMMMNSQQSCSLCGSKIHLVQINLMEAILLCPNVKCLYPFSRPSIDLRFVTRTLIRDIEKETTTSDGSDEIVCSPPPEGVMDEGHDCLNDILGNWADNTPMSEDDIKAIDSMFEDLQNLKS